MACLRAIACAIRLVDRFLVCVGRVSLVATHFRNRVGSQEHGGAAASSLQSFTEQPARGRREARNMTRPWHDMPARTVACQRRLAASGWRP